MKHNGFFHTASNPQTVWLMIWETDPRKMKPNQSVKICHKEEVKSGDSILVNKKGEPPKELLYKINNVVSTRPAAMKGMLYSEVLINREFEPIQ